MTDVSGGSEPAVRVSKLGYVQFTTPDVDRLVDYYTKVLDFAAGRAGASGCLPDHRLRPPQRGHQPG